MENEKKLVEWFINELNTNYSIIKSISNDFDINFGIFEGNIENMIFSVNNSSIKLESEMTNFSNKYDINLNYIIQHKENLNYLHTELSKIYKKYFEDYNQKSLDLFIDNINKKQYKTILVKVNEIYNDYMIEEGHEFIDKSRIDGQHIFKLKFKLPEFEIIQNMNNIIK